MQKIVINVRHIIELELSDEETLSTGTVRKVEKGWVVNLNDWQNLEGKEGMFKAIVIASLTTGFASGYKDADVELWDVVLVFDSEAEATEAGNHFGQMKIWNLETGAIKWLK